MTDKIYCKILRDDLFECNMEMHEGLNEMNCEFNDDRDDTRCVGGYWFTTLDNIHNFYNFGKYFSIVNIFDNAKYVRFNNRNVWRTDKIYVDKLYNLYDIETIKKFNLTITFDLMMYVVQFKNITDNNELFDYLQIDPIKKQELLRNITNDNLRIVSLRGYENVFNWWHNMGYKFNKSNIDDIVQATMTNGTTNILDWLINHNYDIKIFPKASFCSIGSTNDKIREWFKKNGYCIYIKGKMEYIANHKI